MQLSSIRKRSAQWLWLIVPLFAILGWFYPLIGFAMLICMAAPVLVAMKRGRHWCGWMCPRGAFFDFIMARLGNHPPAPAWLRSLSFRMAMRLMLIGMMGVLLILTWPDPLAMGRVFIILFIVSTVIGIVLAVYYPARTWCTFCPMGSISANVAKKQRAMTVKDSCHDCHACGKVCPMQLTPQQPDATHADCLKCGTCVARCPVQALSLQEHAAQQTSADTSA